MTSELRAFPDRVVRITGARDAGALAERFPSAPSAVVIGNFDGVHRGHQAVLAEAAALASARGLATTVLTFDPHPVVVLAGATPATLTAMPHRTALLLGIVDRVCVRSFDAEFAATPPERFAEELLASALGAKLVVVGEDFRFGHKRAGDLALLRALGEKWSFEVFAHGLAGDDAGRFSSSRARDAVTQGNVAAATHVLGRPHSFAGRVVHGDARGRTIGFPTANLAAISELLPAYGVYAVRVERVCSPDGALVEEVEPLGVGVLNHGVRPTVASGLAATVEAHLFDFDRDLYHQRLRVHLVERLRGEKRFGGIDELRAQIARDAEAGRRALSSLARGGDPNQDGPR